MHGRSEPSRFFRILWKYILQSDVEALTELRDKFGYDPESYGFGRMQPQQVRSFQLARTYLCRVSAEYMSVPTARLMCDNRFLTSESRVLTSTQKSFGDIACIDICYRILYCMHCQVFRVVSTLQLIVLMRNVDLLHVFFDACEKWNCKWSPEAITRLSTTDSAGKTACEVTPAVQYHFGFGVDSAPNSKWNDPSGPDFPRLKIKD